MLRNTNSYNGGFHQWRVGISLTRGSVATLHATNALGPIPLGVHTHCMLIGDAVGHDRAR